MRSDDEATPMITRLLLVFILAVVPLSARAAETVDAASFFSLNMGDLKAELADARKDRKKAVMVMFEQEGCPGCRHMRQHVLNRSDVQAYYRSQFATLALDIYSSVPVKDFTSREHTEKGFAQASKVKGTPTFIFYDLSGNEIVRYFGPTQTPEEFLLLGEFVSSGAYRTRNFAQFKREQPARKGT